MSVLYLVIIILYTIPSYFLLMFANKTKIAIQNEDSLNLELAFKNQKYFYKFLGIMIIIFIIFYILSTVTLLLIFKNY